MVPVGSHLIALTCGRKTGKQKYIHISKTYIELGAGGVLFDSV
jgi:hypothetical protein